MSDKRFPYSIQASDRWRIGDGWNSVEVHKVWCDGVLIWETGDPWSVDEAMQRAEERLAGGRSLVPI